MLNEKVVEKVDKILNELSKEEYASKLHGVDLREDFMDLLEEYSDIAKELEDIKYNKIIFFASDESDSVGFTLSEVQVEFTVEVGEDEEGPWYEVSCDVISFGGEE